MNAESQSRDILLRVSVPEAASRLGVTQSAIRKRVQRRQISFDKDEHGHTYVYLSPEESQSRDRDASHGTEAGVTGLSPDESHKGAADELTSRVAFLENQVRFLQDELISRREEAQRKDTIIMTMTSRIPELEPASGPRESPEIPAEGADKGDAPPEPERLSWWRRMFGG